MIDFTFGKKSTRKDLWAFQNTVPMIFPADACNLNNFILETSNNAIALIAIEILTLNDVFKSHQHYQFS